MANFIHFFVFVVGFVLAIFICRAVRKRIDKKHEDNENRHTAFISYEGKDYEFRYWTESDVADWLYAGVYEVLPPKIRRGKVIPQYNCIGKTCRESDRVDWCWETLEEYVEAQRQIERDRQKILEICGELEEG